MLKLSLRRWLVLGLMVAALGAGVMGGLRGVTAADAEPAAAKHSAPGAVTVESLGKVLSALKLKVDHTESRYDFAFMTKQAEEWELSMSVVLSNDEKTLWIMAWLDELPQSSADVPRTALLRLLADNDKMGNGQFFAYVPSNRRFVLQRVIANENITPVLMRDTLIELGKTVINTHPHWSTPNWKLPISDDATETAPQPTITKAGAAAAKTASGNSATKSNSKK